MGRYTFRLPDIGEGIAEAEIVAWHVKPGDTVEEDGPLADMMTDKATVELESPVSGTVLEVGGEVGDRLAIGSALAVIEVAGEGNDAGNGAGGGRRKPVATPSPASQPEEPEPPVENAPEPQGEPAAPLPPPPPPASPPPQPAAGPRASDAKVLASPAVRARARDLGADRGRVAPYG